MRGPFMLRPLQIDMSVPCRIGGVYALGKNPRQIRYLGGADRNLREAIKAHWNEYEFFWYKTTLSTRDCYTSLCQAYHKQMNNGGLDSAEHPVVPAGVDVKCQVCGK